MPVTVAEHAVNADVYRSVGHYKHVGEGYEFDVQIVELQFLHYVDYEALK
jgi:hypothetical protein